MFPASGQRRGGLVHADTGANPGLFGAGLSERESATGGHRRADSLRVVMTVGLPIPCFRINASTWPGQSLQLGARIQRVEVPHPERKYCRATRTPQYIQGLLPVVASCEALKRRLRSLHYTYFPLERYSVMLPAADIQSATPWRAFLPSETAHFRLHPTNLSGEGQ